VAAENSSHPSGAGGSIAGTDVEPARAAEHERPEDWGWHHQFTTGRQLAGWSTFMVLGLLLTTTHYNRTGDLALVLMMLALASGLLWDRKQRRTQWRG